jgi:hypothetical protein
MEILGIDVSEYRMQIRGDDIVHIERRHGKNGEQDSSMADVRDIARVGYVLQHFDNVHYAGLDREMANRDDSPASMILLEKKIDGYYYVAEAVPDNSRKIIYIKSAYRNEHKNRSLTSSGWKNPPTLTSENAHVSTPIADLSVPQAAPGVKGENKQTPWESWFTNPEEPGGQFSFKEDGGDDEASRKMWSGNFYTPISTPASREKLG